MARTDSAAARTLRWLDWTFNPAYRGHVEDVYALIGERTLTGGTRYLNLGDWRTAHDVDTACEALVRRVGDAAGLGPGDRVVDAGFGFGAQDVAWVERHGVEEIVGLNLSALQVRAARQRVAAHGLSDRIRLLRASATRMPLADGTYDAVIALESAFHFRTREDFFREAHRVLRPGGRLVTADILPRAGALSRPSPAALAWHYAATRFDMPYVNAYPAAEYRRRLARAGFAQAQIASIRDDVYVPLHEALVRDPGALARQHPIARLTFTLARHLPPKRLFAAFDYVIAVAFKPA